MFSRYRLNSTVFFARKANKGKCFVKAAKECGFGVDTASLNEMKECIELGLSPEKITVTAAVKNRELLGYAITNRIPVIVDNWDECDLLHQLLVDMNRTLQVGFRVSGFEYGGEKLYSRFGFDSEEICETITSTMGDSGKYHKFRYHGLHFHLNGYSIPQRAGALSQTLDVADALANNGFRTRYIDIGGGIVMNYLASSEEWENFHKVLRDSLLTEVDEITFQKDPLGMVKVDNKLLGEPKVYPYYNEVFQDRFVEAILTTAKEGAPLYRHLIDRDIELRIEPGRSLLDQSGITIARVAFRKKDAEGRTLVGLEMNRTQMFSSSADYLLDPLFIPQHPKPGSPTEVYFVGAYCLEQELILKRKISLPQYPEIGDLICFVNTAGYMMHFYESEAHRFDLARNLVVEKTSGWQAFPDEEII